MIISGFGDFLNGLVRILIEVSDTNITFGVG